MDLPWGDEKTGAFITNVGIVTSTGPHGPNAMACEWTHMVSYNPGLVAVCLGHNKATTENIRESKEFGVSLASTEQTVLSSIAGGSTGRKVNKISALEEMGFKFYNAKKIKAPMVYGAAVNIECRVVEEIKLGDHTMFVGEALTAKADTSKEPVAYHKGMYGRVVMNHPKPNEKERDRLNKIVDKHRK